MFRHLVEVTSGQGTHQLSLTNTVTANQTVFVALIELNAGTFK